MQDEKQDLTPMVKVLNDLHKEGYTSQFKVVKHELISMADEKKFKSSDVEIRHFYRFEGESDPDDNSIVYAIETNTGQKGTLVDSYGAYADPYIGQFIKDVEAIKR